MELLHFRPVETGELAGAVALIENAAESRRYWVAPRGLPTTTWSEYKTEIAMAIDSALDWRLITSAYDAVNDLNWIVQDRRARTPATEEHEFGARLDEHNNAGEMANDSAGD